MKTFLPLILFVPLLAGAQVSDLLDLSRRQIFLDDALVAESRNAEKIYHQARTMPERVIACDTAVETQRRWIDIPSVVRDEKTGKFRMWYTAMVNRLAGELPKRTYSLVTMYAESRDGLKWTKPELGLVEAAGDNAANNILSAAWLRVVLPDPGGGGFVALEARPYTWYQLDGAGRIAGTNVLGDMINNDTIPNLKETRARVAKFISDEARAGWDPVTRSFLASIKTGAVVKASVAPDRYRRAVAFASSPDGTDWKFNGCIVTGDADDDAFLKNQTYVDGTKPAWAELDNMPVFRYGNVIIGLMTLMYLYNGNEGGLNSEVFLAWSDDGITWRRTHPREAFVAAPATAPNFGFFKAGVTPPVRVGDELWFYHGWGGRANNGDNKVADPAGKGIGLSKLRLDGFASLRAGEKEAVVETKRFAITDRPLRVNGDFSKGICTVELVGDDATVASKPLTSDGVALPIQWDGPLPKGDGFLRFRFSQGDLYSFFLE